jgi:quercetin dioxygenase-like cupin family protein
VKKAFLFISFIILCSDILAQQQTVLDGVYLNEDSGTLRICPDSLKWTDTKPPLPPGAKVAVLEGNPKEAGHFTIRIKMPPNYKIPPHMHPVDERATVLSGAMYVGIGDTMDTAKAQKISAGCFYINPAGMHHYAFTGKEETIIQISTNGPWGSTYLQTIEH